MENDIYIRRISGIFSTPEKTATELYKFMSPIFEEFQSANEWGEIDYLVIPPKTKLAQDDFIGFLAFKNRKIHLELVNELKSIQPIDFHKRGMLFELNCKPTSLETQKENRRRFENYFKPVLKNKRYFETEETEETDEPISKKSKSSSNATLPSTSRASLDFIQLIDSQENLNKCEGTETEMKLKRKLQKRNLEYVALEVQVELLKQELETKNELVNRLLKEREETSVLLLTVSKNLANKP